MILNQKKAALELSVGTVVILVLGVTMLIMGMVVTRSVMCGALGLTGEVNGKVRGELDKLFDSTEGEIACVGSGDAVKMIPGETNIVHCSIRAPEKAQYKIEVASVGSTSSSISKETVQKWVATKSAWEGQIAPGDFDSKKPVRLVIPNNAPEGNIQLQLKVYRNNELISTQDLDFEISRIGFVRSAAC